METPSTYLPRPPHALYRQFVPPHAHYWQFVPPHALYWQFVPPYAGVTALWDAEKSNCHFSTLLCKNAEIITTL